LGRRIGSELVPAVLFGGIAVMLALRAGRRRVGKAAGGTRVLQCAMVAAIALWLAIGIVGFSVMSRLEVRYLETLTPAIAAAFGIGVVALSREAMHGRTRIFLAVLASLSAYGVYLARGDQVLQLVVLSAAVAAAALVVARPDLHGAVPAVTGCLAVMALLAVPVSDSIAI